MNYDHHCVKTVRIRSFSGSYFPAFDLNTEIYRVNSVVTLNSGIYGQEKLRIWTLFTQW